MVRASAAVVASFTLCALAAGRADADETAGLATAIDRDDTRQVALAADVGFSGGGAVTPGGLRVGGHYLYRLSDHDWFDSSLAFTFGGRGDVCSPVAGRTRELALAPGPVGCDRAVTDGFAADLGFGLRRELASHGGFTPFVRAAGFLRALRVVDGGGFAAGGSLGGGVRAPVTPDVAVVAGGEVFLGAGWVDGVTGNDHQLGLTITVGAELNMK